MADFITLNLNLKEKEVQNMNQLISLNKEIQNQFIDVKNQHPTFKIKAEKLKTNFISKISDLKSDSFTLFKSRMEENSNILQKHHYSKLFLNQPTKSIIDLSLKYDQSKAVIFENKYLIKRDSNKPQLVDLNKEDLNPFNIESKLLKKKEQTLGKDIYSCFTINFSKMLLRVYRTYKFNLNLTKFLKKTKIVKVVLKFCTRKIFRSMKSKLLARIIFLQKTISQYLKKKFQRSYSI